MRSTFAVVLVVGLVAGCSPGGAEEPAAEQSRQTARPTASAYAIPDPDEVDSADPQEVCDAFADTLLSGDPVTESQAAPVRRAAEYVSDDYRQSILDESPRLAGWNQWAAAGVRKLRRTRIPGPQGQDPPEGNGRWQYRQAARRVVPLDERGNIAGETQTYVFYCTLVRGREGWSIAVHSQAEYDPSG